MIIPTVSTFVVISDSSALALRMASEQTDISQSLYPTGAGVKQTILKGSCREFSPRNSLEHAFSISKTFRTHN